MRSITWLLLAASTFCSSTTCDAGGFFRRVPEVGEWARYEAHIEVKESYGKSSTRTSLFEGTFTIKCVGEEVIDDRRQLWIECREDYVLDNGRPYRTVIKLLVPEEGIVDGSIAADDVRGWYGWVAEKPSTIRFSTGSWTKDTGSWWLTTLFGDPPCTGTQLEPRTVTVNENEVELDRSETRPIPPPDFVDATYDGHTTYWLSDDLAFGVASADAVWLVRYENTYVTEKHGDTRFDLVATGTDAESDLPDHN
jgi:hypothetical protein